MCSRQISCTFAKVKIELKIKIEVIIEFFMYIAVSLNCDYPHAIKSNLNSRSCVYNFTLDKISKVTRYIPFLFYIDFKS
jgi:hypothetical protein